MAKTLNALVYPSAPTIVVERRMIDVANIPAHKAAWWRPVVVEGDATFDPATQIKTGPVTTIEAGRVLDTWTIRAKTAAELEADKDAQFDSVDPRLLRKLLFDTHKRLNVLEGKPPGTAAAFKTYAKAL